mmetsp:Transcript_23799/g.42871  ORF Transcript_23799/g.42871 Transcript_23799/m.42871 type:complete len:211 (-) Transcript_23799:687-1319(-)
MAPQSPCQSAHQPAASTESWDGNRTLTLGMLHRRWQHNECLNSILQPTHQFRPQVECQVAYSAVRVDTHRTNGGKPSVWSSQHNRRTVGAAEADLRRKAPASWHPRGPPVQRLHGDSLPWMMDERVAAHECVFCVYSTTVANGCLWHPQVFQHCQSTWRCRQHHASRTITHMPLRLKAFRILTPVNVRSTLRGGPFAQGKVRTGIGVSTV